MRRAALCLTVAPCAVRAVAWLGRLAHPRAATVAKHTIIAFTNGLRRRQAALAVLPILWSTVRTASAREHQPPASFVRTLDSARSSMTPQLGSLRRQCLTERAYKSPKPSVRLHYAARSLIRALRRAGRLDCCPCRPFATWSCAVRRTCNHRDRTLACAPRRQGTALPLSAGRIAPWLVPPQYRSGKPMRPR